jgi:hypothetical protein
VEVQCAQVLALDSAAPACRWPATCLRANSAFGPRASPSPSQTSLTATRVQRRSGVPGGGGHEFKQKALGLQGNPCRPMRVVFLLQLDDSKCVRCVALRIRHFATPSIMFVAWRFSCVNAFLSQIV